MHTKEEIEFILKAYYNNLVNQSSLGASIAFTRLRNAGYTEKQIIDMMKKRFPVKVYSKKKKKKGKK